MFDKTAGSIQEQADKLSAMDTIAVSEGEDLDRQLAAISQKTEVDSALDALKARLAEGGTTVRRAREAEGEDLLGLRREVGPGRGRSAVRGHCSLGACMMASGALGAGAGVNRQAAALHEMMRAVNAGDAAAYARVYAEGAVITIHGGGVLSGRRAIEAYEIDLLREFPGTQLAFYDFWQSGAAVVVHYGVDGRTPAGQAMGHEGLLFYRFEPSGLIADERRYLDSATPMAQLGLLGPSPARPRPALPRTMQAHLAGSSPARGGAMPPSSGPPSRPWTPGTKRRSSRPSPTTASSTT